MHVMNITTAIEFLVYIAQWWMLIAQLSDKSADQICADSPLLPTLKEKHCGGILWTIYVVNGAFLILYIYFCAVTYEHYFMGLLRPDFRAAEAKLIEKEIQQKRLDQEAAKLEEAERLKNTQEFIQAVETAVEKRLLENESAYPDVTNLRPPMPSNEQPHINQSTRMSARNSVPI